MSVATCVASLHTFSALLFVYLHFCRMSLVCSSQPAHPGTSMWAVHVVLGSLSRLLCAALRSILLVVITPCLPPPDPGVLAVCCVLG